MSVASGQFELAISERRFWLALSLVLAAYVAAYIAPLNIRPLISPDETRYAEVPREMLSANSWLTPQLNSLRYFEKPVLGYWLNAASIALFGEHEFAVRLPGALACALTALLVGMLCFQLSRSARTSIFASAVYLSFAAVYLIGTISVLDNFLVTFLTAGFLFFYLSTTTAGTKLRWLALLAGIGFGCAFLVKGFLAFVLPIVVIVPWIILNRHWRRSYPILGFSVLGAAIVTLPWSIAIHNQEPDFWRYFVWEEHLRRFAGERAQHKQPFYYFLVLLPGLAFPWLAMTPTVVASLRQQRRRGAIVTEGFWYLILWMIVPFVFFSIASGKLATYTLPCFPPAAILIALGLTRQFANEKLTRIGLSANVLMFLSLITGLFVVQLSAQPLFGADETLKLLLLASALVSGAALSLSVIFAYRHSSWIITASVLPLMLMAPLSIPNSFLIRKAPGLLLETYESQIPRDALIVSDSGFIRGVGWYWQRDNVYMIAAGELAYGLSYPDANARLLNPGALRNLVRDKQFERDIILVCKRRCPSNFLETLPKSMMKTTLGHIVIWHHRSKNAPLSNGA